jgi:hypothetical protein
VSKRTDAKKARRRKRVAERERRRLVGEIVRGLLSFEGIDEVLTERGWEFDVDNSTDELATWFWAESALDTDDEDLEPVTRIWLTIGEDEEIDDADLEWHVLFVGGDAEATDYVFSGESLLEHLAAIEEYRHGDPAFEV